MKKQIYSALIMSLITANTMMSCKTSNKSNDKQTNTVINNSQIDSNYLIISDEQRKAFDSCNQFAINIFKTQMGMDSKVISPLSISYVMNILANGAEDNTLSSIQTALCQQGLSLNDINEAYKILLNYSKEEQNVKIKIANSIVANKNIKLKNDYSKAMSSLYEADVKSLDFCSPTSVEIINKWCDKQTDGMIPNIISQLNPTDMAVMLNAIYFNGTWAKSFTKNDTKTERFQGYTRDIKQVKMMHQENNFMYTKNDKFAAVTLPYKGGNYSMTILLPNRGISIEDMMNKLNAANFKELKNNMNNNIVDLKLPRFSVLSDFKLKNVLSSIGAKEAFSSTANFSKISDSEFFISEVLHKAKIEVTEEGTKAAAVTAAIMTMSALPQQEMKVSFHADRPFVYVITENTTGAIYFIGQYTGDDC